MATNDKWVEFSDLEGRHLNVDTIARRLMVNPVIAHQILIACNTHQYLLQACKAHLDEIAALEQVWGTGPHLKDCDCATCLIRTAVADVMKARG